MMKVALLSNINVDPVNRQLSTVPETEIYHSQGYGNELGILLNRQSPIYEFDPDIIFIIMDIMELVQHNLEISDAAQKINDWFSLFESAMSEETIYYLSDAYLYGFEMDVVWNRRGKADIENEWNDRLAALIDRQSNVRIFGYNRLIEITGEKDAFSSKMWYMGKILHSTALQKSLAGEIRHKIDIEQRQPKKALFLDLDNTLWRGLAGENDITPIVLSEDGVGLAYKNFQRAIRQLKTQGVILGIVSKNNEADAFSIISDHPHMVLRPEDFAAHRINWENKADNIVSLTKELNIGLDAVVFIDDNEAEQALIREALPEVYVPEFPERPEELVGFISGIYYDYFEKPVVTKEDREKTRQYQANSERRKLQESSVDFAGYLDSLKMKMYRVDPVKNKERLVQLINKTNQFNLTTRRVTEQEIAKILQDDAAEVFLYRVTDRFGDNGIVAVAIVEYGKEAVITEFTMSCRVMGRKIEDAIIEDMEASARSRGFNEIIGIYKPTKKNKPVETLYPSLGYTLRKTDGEGVSEFVMAIEKDQSREIHIEKLKEE